MGKIWYNKNSQKRDKGNEEIENEYREKNYNMDINFNRGFCAFRFSNLCRTKFYL